MFDETAPTRGFPEEDFEVLISQLRSRRPPIAFAPADAVRRRGRQRAHRQALAAGVAVFAVISGSAGIGWGTLADNARLTPHPIPPGASSVSPPQTSRTPPARTSPRPRGTVVPPGALLQPSDLGPGAWYDYGAEMSEGGADVPWWWLDHACEGYDRAHYPAIQHQLDLRYVGYTVPSRVFRVDEIVEQYAPGWGAQSLADVRRVVDFCTGRGAWNAEVTGAGPTRQTIIDTDVAGEESILLRTEPSFYDENNKLTPNPHVSYTVVVRVGDRVATIFVDDRDENLARTVAEWAADRL